MKILKRISLLAVMLAFSVVFASAVEARGFFPRNPSNTPTDSGSGRTYQHNHQQRGGQAGAPLDGGLLAILAAAGGAYVIGRRKKKNAE